MLDPNIIDFDAFNTLFLEPKDNHDAIFVAMRELARRTSGTLNFKSPEDREDGITDALIHAMRRVDKYRPGRQRAAAYFFRMLRRHMVKFIAANKKMLHEYGGEDGSSGSIFDQKRMPLEARHVSQYRRFDTLLESEGDKVRARRVLDRALCRAVKLSEAAATDIEKTQGATAVDVLQNVRKQMLGRFNRVCADHATYTDTRRLERDH